MFLAEPLRQTRNAIHTPKLPLPFYNKKMKQRLLKALEVSLEWRIIAFVITELFLWATTGELWHATMLAVGLQAVLFIAYFGWYFVRETHP